MITIDLITGFLGSGKTTFLLKYARFLMKQGLKVGILEYDYGALNVDMLLLNKLRGDRCEIEMVAAACDEDCLKRRFTTKLISMAMSGYDRVIVEPSGVFDMDMFFDAVRDEPLDKWYDIGSVITVVNARLPQDMSEEEDFVLASQAADAGIILLSRTQMATEQEIIDTKEHIKKAAMQIKCNKFSPKYFEKNWAEFTDSDFVKLATCGFVVNDYVKSFAGHNSDFDSICFLGLPDTLEGLKSKISKLFENSEYGNIMRVKGFAQNGDISYQINATRGEIFAEPIGIGQGDVIVIGIQLDKEKIKEFMNS